MKIALALDRFDPRLGGLEHWALQLATWLASRGHGVHIVAGECRTGVAPAGVSLHQTGRPASRLARADAITARVRAIGADVVHDLGSGWHYDVLHPLFGSRRVSIERQQAALSPLQRWRQALSPRVRRRWFELRRIETRQLASSRGHVVAASRMVADAFERRHGVDRRRLRVIYNGVDTHRFSPEACAPGREAMRAALGIPSDAMVFLTVAMNLRLKGVPTSMRALAELQADGCHVRFVVAGARPTPDLQRLARRLGIGKAVVWAGHLDDPVPCYGAADAFVLPTWHDPCSLSVLEAWACGLPAITTRWNGASELMVDGTHGFAVEDAGDAAAVARAMRRLLDREDRRGMGLAARALALDHTLESKFLEIERLY